MRLSIIGTGHVGLVTGACLAEHGHEVLCVDRDERKIASLQAGVMPFYEPGLEALVRARHDAGRLRFGVDNREAVSFGEIVFLCVPTPPDVDGAADLSCVEAVSREIARATTGYRLIVEKSTVPVNTGDRVRASLRRHSPPGVDFDVASNPEFLREGSAVQDALHPDRIVVGVDSPRAERLMRELYASFEAPLVMTDLRSAEMIKHASNAFLALKISYINAVAAVCDRAGASVTDVARGMGLDRRIGPQFLQAGIGYGGSCFPKDVAAFAAIARDLGYDFGLLREVERVNREARERFLEKVREELWIVKGKTIAALGLSFKPETDDLRESVSVEVARRLQAQGARIRTYDPKANGQVKSMLPGADICDSPYEAARGADCALILTEWDEFRRLDFERLRRVMGHPTLIDGRNLFEPRDVRRHGFVYRSVGRD